MSEARGAAPVPRTSLGSASGNTNEMPRGNSKSTPSNPPAFQKYARDWLAGRRCRSLRSAERAAYDDLLCVQWLDDAIPTDPDELRELLVGLGHGPCLADDTPAPFRIRLDRILALFPDGRNERLASQRRSLDARRERKRAAGRAGAAARWGDDEAAQVSGSDGSASGSANATAMPSDSSAVAVASSEEDPGEQSKAGEKGNGGAARPRVLLERMNDRREQLSLRRLKPTDGNIRPIKARLTDYTAEQILVAWYGASVDDWVISNNRLLPSHVLRPSTIEGYIDAGSKARRESNGKHPPKPTTKNVRWECTECGTGTMVTLPIDDDAERPDGFKCGGCLERGAPVPDGGPTRIADILGSIKPKGSGK